MPSPARWKTLLSHASRSRGFLWKLAIGIILAGAAIGAALHRVAPPAPGTFDQRVLTTLPFLSDTSHAALAALSENVVRSFERELADPALAPEDFLDALPRLRPLLTGETVRVSALVAKRFTPSTGALVADFLLLDSRHDTAHPTARERLEASATRDAPVLFANYLLGLHAREKNDLPAAARHFIAEGRFSEAHAARDHAIQSLLDSKQFTALEALVREPAYAGLLTPYDHLDLAVARRDWPAILRTLPAAQFATHLDGALALTLVTGIAWAFFLFHLGENRRALSATTALCLTALVLGALSTFPTICAAIWQEDMLGLGANTESLPYLAYQVGGVGLREELSKLLLLLPLLPFLVARRDEREALLVASFIGLGFAIEENGGYFLNSHGIDAPGRFLSANFLHIALTGLNGLAFVRIFTRGAAGLNQFLTVFPLTILVHGLYNGLPAVVELQELGPFLAMTIFVLFSVGYFNRAHELRENERMTLSLTGAFVFSISLVAAAVLIGQISAIGLGGGLTALFPEFLATGILILMFTRVFNEGLSE